MDAPEHGAAPIERRFGPWGQTNPSHTVVSVAGHDGPVSVTPDGRVCLPCQRLDLSPRPRRRIAFGLASLAFGLGALGSGLGPHGPEWASKGHDSELDPVHADQCLAWGRKPKQQLNVGLVCFYCARTWEGQFQKEYASPKALASTMGADKAVGARFFSKRHQCVSYFIEKGASKDLQLNRGRIDWSAGAVS
eukprot:5438990-Pyramimonas_sp.AAC.1